MSASSSSPVGTRSARRRAGAVLGVAAVLVLAPLAVSRLGVPSPVARRVARARSVAASTAVRVWRLAYRAHDGTRRAAYVALPAWYGPRRDPPLPLVIAPHGRGVGPRANLRLWGDLPGIGSFAVVSPAGEGLYSWGAPTQIRDLAEMPALVARRLPWVHVDRRRVFAFGGSMGGQETLLLVAEHPHLLAGAAAFDSVANFALQYREFPRLRCDPRCRRRWREPVGLGLQAIARKEIGGTPATDPRGYVIRSPLDRAAAIARSRVPLELWWSTRDLVVRDQREQSAALYRRIVALDPRAPVEAFVGTWAHTAEMRASTRLPFALAQLGLLPSRFDRPAPGARRLQPPQGWASAVPVPSLEEAS